MPRINQKIDFHCPKCEKKWTGFQDAHKNWNPSVRNKHYCEKCERFLFIYDPGKGALVDSDAAMLGF